MNSAVKIKTGLLHKLSNTFITGLLAVLPITLTIAFIVWFADFIHRFLGPKSIIGELLGSFGLKFVTSEITAYIIGLLITLLIVYLLGVFVEAGMKNRWQTLIDNIFNSVPLVRNVYNTLNKLMQIFEQKEQAEIKSMSAVMCHFGGKQGGTVVLAVLTSPEPIQMNDQDYYAVMIPTAPIPFGGALLYVPVDWVEVADFEFDGLLNIYMSMGVTSPDYLNKQSEQYSNKKT